MIERRNLRHLILGLGLVVAFTNGCGKEDVVVEASVEEVVEEEVVVEPPTCKRTVVAEVAVLSQQLVYNRLGTTQSASQIFSLARDIEVKTVGSATWTWLIDTPEWVTYQKCRDKGQACLPELQAVAEAHSAASTITTNNGADNREVRIRTDRRPRPMVLRANVKDCLEVNFVNLLPTAPQTTAGAANSNDVGFHPVGMQLVSAITNDGQFIGDNNNSLSAPVNVTATGSQPTPGVARQYKYYASNEAVHFVSSSSDSNDGQLNAGLFGAIHVQPETAEYYRSQVTEADLALAGGGVYPPVIDYGKRFAAGNTEPWKGSGVPILSMLDDKGDPATKRPELIYSDLTAIITGPNAGAFSPKLESPVFTKNPASPNRRQPYREFTIIYHEPGAATQAFASIFTGGGMDNTLEAGKDLFGINYGTGGIGAEILANRLGVGPMADCADCRYEEFFLSAWTVGDPAMNVDSPAGILAGAANYQAVPPAQVAKYPDDPSNVYHSYIGDHVKMRLHHGGGIHHLHHLHAHQWLHSPDSDEGHYLDSQLIGPGASFTLEMAYNGSGNRNQTVGDSIFHCHFYPHFAEGMWAMWRVHDVYEAGTKLENLDITRYGLTTTYRVPSSDARALPDGEIERGTPIPGLVPVPTLPIAPNPSKVYIADGQVHFGDKAANDRWGTTVTKNPGYPFFIPGNAGSRAPHPPLDMAPNPDAGAPPDQKYLDGGLPRHLVLSGSDIVHYENAYDFSRFSNKLQAVELPEDGLNVEKVAMAAHAERNNNGFIYNGMPHQPGAPYADPCYDVDPVCLKKHDGNYNACPAIAVPGTPRQYRAADLQHDVVLNKEGWHYPQQRMEVLWGDIEDTLDNTRPPQPFFFRANSGECIEFWMTNLVPAYYEADNFQIRTPTDILGQHIHLVKFDVTSSDGAANGWNYEDGTFSYEEVVDRIEEINAGGKLGSLDPSVPARELTAREPTYLGLDPANTKKYKGAQTTVQRWWADPLLNNLGKDRTIRTVFTHDHFGPSTHQQAGLYAGLLVEPTGSTWWDAEDSTTQLGSGRTDGGPTSWQAVIKTGQSGYREFALEFQDLSVAYEGGGTYAGTPYPASNRTKTPAQVTAQNSALNGLNPATDGKRVRTLVGGYVYVPKDSSSSPPIAAPPTPQLVSAPFGGLWGGYAVNYRSEPLALRASKSDPTQHCAQGDKQCDNAYLFASIERDLGVLNDQHISEQVNADPAVSYPPALTSGVYGTDPFTPLLRAYEGEHVQIRTLVGAHVQMHNFALHGFNWLFEPSNGRSGYRDSQSMGISEHFEMEFDMPPVTTATAPSAAKPPTNTCGAAAGAEAFADYLYTPSSSIAGLVNGNWGVIRSYKQGTAACLTPVPVPGTPAPVPAWSCPTGAPTREFKVAAYNANLVYNNRGNTSNTPDGMGVSNPAALIYTGCDMTQDPTCKPADPGAAPNSTIDPLILRVVAGECVKVTLENKFDATAPVFSKSNTSLAAPITPMAGSVTFQGVTANPSQFAGLHPQMLAFDGSQSSGLNIGLNQKDQTAAPGDSVSYTWYAGIVKPDGSGTPVEFGVVNLFTADPLLQSGVGLAGALVVEPTGATWQPGDATKTQATITTAAGSFEDIVLITIDGVAAVDGIFSGPSATANHANVVLANYGTEPVAQRFAAGVTNQACQYSDLLVNSEPMTPVFTVKSADTPVRFRVVHPWGNDQQVFELFGQLWQEEPYSADSTSFASNTTSEYQGFRAGWGSTDRINVILDHAGGPFEVKGDYLYRLRDVSLQATLGVWGVMRVGDQPAATEAPAYCSGGVTTVPTPFTPVEAHPREVVGLRVNVARP